MEPMVFRDDNNRSRITGILFVGLGAMGSPMARRVAHGGVCQRLYVADVDPGRVAAISEECGAIPASQIAEYGSIDIVIIMLPDSASVESVVLGSEGLLTVLHPGSTIVDMGSSDPRRTVELAGEAAKAGVTLLDAPVSGGVERAGKGDLAIMLGGSDEAVAIVEPLFSLLGSTITRTGPVGSGHAMKALNNMLSAVGLLAASEVMAVGIRFGLDPRIMLEVLNNSTGQNHATQNKFARFVLSRQFNSGFSMKLMVKDLTIAMELAKDIEGGAQIISLCWLSWSKALRHLGPGSDHTEIARYVEERAHVTM